MSKDVIRKYTPEETERRRAEVRADVAKSVARAFETYPKLNSAVLMVGQFWADEADDAVHGDLVYALTSNPDLAAHKAENIRLFEAMVDQRLQGKERDQVDAAYEASTAFIEGVAAERELGGPWGFDHVKFWDNGRSIEDWDSNGESISLFAAFCQEGASQEDAMAAAYTPYCIFRRGANGVEVEIIGQMLRPWLDGVAPEWESNE